MRSESPHCTDAVVLGAGLAGCVAALELAHNGQPVTLIDRTRRPMMGASRHNEGKLHFGYVYAADKRLETHGILACGSLGFLAELERLTGFPRDRFAVSDLFTYIVPRDSALRCDDICTYFDTVDDTLARLASEMALPSLGRVRQTTQAFRAAHYDDSVQMALHTPEIAVDPGQVSDVVAAAVYAHPLIHFLGQHSVQEVAETSPGRYRITLDAGEDRVHVAARGVINALWEDRLHMDAMVGLPPQGVWSQRWKATVMIEPPSGAVQLPSTTALVGPYGDFVQYGNTRIYVSWYPVCRLSMSTTGTPEEARALVRASDHAQIRANALEGLSHLIPGVRDLAQYADNTIIGGGFIMAAGDRDIDDRQSGLHARHDIGVERHGSWVSLSTGKFCTAPMFGVKAARALQEVLG
ncbi:FAD-dependent oxidoreductase [uncultured Tateyamaria sp.]|uniref:FAD-dependent oxidoreductase n=1 Tax=Tateyamaria sp. 1078 TaxID=3417464 RepID=UPI00262EA7D6|nr:FAD-dependent oxidoreductase [uncultured Tateyamaria sp.]